MVGQSASPPFSLSGNWPTNQLTDSAQMTYLEVGRLVDVVRPEIDKKKVQSFGGRSAGSFMSIQDKKFVLTPLMCLSAMLTNSNLNMGAVPSAAGDRR